MLDAMKRGAAMLLCCLVAACSMEGMINTMTSEEDREMAMEFVEDIRTRDVEGLQEVVDPDLWMQSAPQFEQAATLFPRGDGETQIIGYSMNSDGLGEGARTTKEFTLVTSDDEHWTTTRFSTLEEGGSDPLVVSWNVEGSDEPPPDLEVMENVGQVFMWLGIIALLFLAGLIALIVWLVRRSRRKDAERNAGIS